VLFQLMDIAKVVTWVMPKLKIGGAFSHIRVLVSFFPDHRNLESILNFWRKSPMYD